MREFSSQTFNSIWRPTCKGRKGTILGWHVSQRQLCPGSAPIAKLTVDVLESGTP